MTGPCPKSQKDLNRSYELTGRWNTAAAHAPAGPVSDGELSPDYIIPAAFGPRVCPAVSKAVAEAAPRTGAART